MEPHPRDVLRGRGGGPWGHGQRWPWWCWVAEGLGDPRRSNLKDSEIPDSNMSSGAAVCPPQHGQLGIILCTQAGESFGFPSLSELCKIPQIPHGFLVVLLHILRCFPDKFPGLQIPGLQTPCDKIPLCWMPPPSKRQICQTLGRSSKAQLKDES